MSNTIVLNSAQGEIAISPETTLEYKGIRLFGYKYTKWDTVINQALVDLMDKIEADLDGGVAQIEFDLDTYTSEEDKKRFDEFGIWKQNILQLVATKISDGVEGIQNNLGTESQTREEQIQTLTTELEKIPNLITQEFETFKSGILEDVIAGSQEGLTGINDKISNLSSQVTDATQSLKQTEETFINKNEEISNANLQFKESVDQSIDDLGRSVNQSIETLSNNTEEKIDNFKNKVNQDVESVNDKLSEMDTKLLNISDDSLTAKISGIISGNVTDMVGEAVNTAVQSIESSINEIETNLENTNKKIDDYIEANDLEITAIKKNNTDSVAAVQEDVDLNTSSIETLDNKVTELLNQSDPEGIQEQFDDLNYEILNVPLSAEADKMIQSRELVGIREDVYNDTVTIHTGVLDFLLNRIEALETEVGMTVEAREDDSNLKSIYTGMKNLSIQNRSNNMEDNLTIRNVLWQEDLIRESGDREEELSFAIFGGDRFLIEKVVFSDGVGNSHTVTFQNTKKIGHNDDTDYGPRQYLYQRYLNRTDQMTVILKGNQVSNTATVTPLTFDSATTFKMVVHYGIHNEQIDTDNPNVTYDRTKTFNFNPKDYLYSSETGNAKINQDLEVINEVDVTQSKNDLQTIIDGFNV